MAVIPSTAPLLDQTPRLGDKVRVPPYAGILDVLQNLLLLAVGLLAWLTRREAARSARVILDKQEEIHKAVNSPLESALEELARVHEKKARETNEDEDIVVAVAARKRFDEHRGVQAAADAARLQVDTDRRKVIADFRAGNITVEGKSRPPVG